MFFTKEISQFLISIVLKIHNIIKNILIYVLHAYILKSKTM